MSFHCAVHASVIVYYVIIIVCDRDGWKKEHEWDVMLDLRELHHLSYNHVIISGNAYMCTHQIYQIYTMNLFDTYRMAHELC